MSRMSPAIRSNTRSHIRSLEKQATTDAMALDGARGMLRSCLLRLEQAEWDAVYHTDKAPERAAKITEYLPHYRTQVAVYYDRTRRLEESVGSLLREALALQKHLDRSERKAAPREPDGLWLLLRMCWLGWRNSRALQ